MRGFAPPLCLSAVLGACSVLPPASWPEAREFDVLATFEAPTVGGSPPSARWTIGLPASDADVTVLALTTRPQRDRDLVVERFDGGVRRLEMAGEVPRLVVRMRLRVRDERTIEDLLPDAERIDVLARSTWRGPGSADSPRDETGR
jgi:hypothetical protein